MKKIFKILLLTFFTSAYAGGHITKAQKEQTIQCLGHYSATAVLPADSIEVENLEMALASVKVIREYLKKEKTRDYISLMWKNFIYLKVVNDDTMNKNKFRFTKMSDSKDITNEIGT